ncbi:RNA polymerase sigma-70 factor [Puteibacter caeruleilacunae]|nr:RNA polymerase sigma-70 factor [Puteibacter caeruleilacunae]
MEQNNEPLNAYSLGVGIILINYIIFDHPKPDTLKKSLDNENRLIRQLKNDNMLAFDQLFRSYSERLFNFSLGYLKSEALADDVVQEVFIRLWDSRKGLKTDTSFKSYLFTIAFNIIRKQFIKKSKEDKFKHDALGTIIEEDNQLEERIDYGSMLERIDNIIEKMPDRRKEVFLRSRKDGLAVKEIAQIMDISPKTVENQITEALKFLKKELEKDDISGILFYSLFFSEKIR